jgi:uncharacterized protein YdaU (DUF1376 family)
MHYYQFNIGDYRKDTGHLSLLEHGIYRLLLDTLYLSECPLPLDKNKIMRSHCIRTKEEKRAFMSVLEEYFSETEKGFINSRTEIQLAKIYEKSEKARLSAKKRWDKINAKDMRTHSNGNAGEMLPNTLIPNNPIPNGKDDCKTRIPYSEIKEIFNETIGKQIGEIREVSPARQKHVKARINEDPDKRFDPEWWRKYFGYASECPLLVGLSAPREEGAKPWKASFDWLVNPNNMVKVLEGKYDA